MQTKPFNYTVPNWSLLEAALVAASLPQSTISEWMWMGEYVASEHSYKHRDTRSYARLTLHIGRTEAARRVLSARGTR